ncbi:MAG: MFS transporter [Halieaceae bacterium]|jgi:MFS family permease|nr:MFS transporter [Halieaceae bacterium]
MPAPRPSSFVFILLTSLYFSQGLPAGLLAHALPALLRQHQVSLEFISYLELLALPWMLKFVWAPYVDRFHFPGTGPHRSWILPMQAAVILLLLLLSQFDPDLIFGSYLLPFFAILLLFNVCSATQDIATDGLTVKLLPSAWRGLGNSIQVSGYKLGMIIGGSLLLLAIDRIGWQSSFFILAGLLALLTVPALVFRERPDINANGGDAPTPASPAFSWQSNLDFFRQPGIALWLVVLVSYKLGDAFGSGMVKPMLVDAGLTLSAIGTLTLASSVAGILAAIVGGLLYYRLGPRLTLLGFGLLQAIGIGGFALIASGQTQLTTIYGVMLFEQMADGMSTVVLFALMMDQCRENHEGADYSLQTCLQVILSGLVGLSSGWIASRVGYELLFLGAGLLGAVVLVPAWYFLRQWAVGDRPANPGGIGAPR